MVLFVMLLVVEVLFLWLFCECLLVMGFFVCGDGVIYV